MKLSTKPIMLAGLLSAGLSAARAGTFSANFNDAQTPPGSSVYSGGGGGVIEATGGVDGTGCFKITKASNSQTGSLVVDDLDAGGDVNSVLATWKMRMGGGTTPPADGVAFCVANGISGTFGPEGTGGGLRVVFDTYNNTPAPAEGQPADPAEAPAVDIYWAGSVVAHLIVPIEYLRTGDAFADASVKLDSDGSLDVSYNGHDLYKDFFIPGYFTIAGAQYAWGGATGGLNENQFIDNLSLTTTTGVVNPGISQAPRAMTVLAGYAGWFSIAVSENSTIQWQKKAPGAPDYSNIAGATDPLLTTPVAAAGDSGTLYRAVVSQNGIDLNSAPVALTVTTLPPPAAQLSYNFNSATPVPAPTELRGDAVAVATGGVGGSGFLQLTPNEGGKSGTWVIPDTRDGAAVDGFFAQFQIDMTPTAGATPADGFGLHFASDLPATGTFAQSEEAVGTGLSVCFDVYNNGNNEAPAVDVFWHGTKVTTVPYPGTFFNTQGGFVDARVRLETDGTLDVSFNGIVAVSNLALPGFYPISGGQIGFSARTGGAFQLQAVDNVDLTTQLFNGPVAVARQPVSYAVVQGYPASFSVLSNDPKRSTYQWQRREPGGSTFTNINGATGTSYTLPAAAWPTDDQAAFRAVLTSTNGSTITTANSDPAVLTVVNLVRPSPAQVIYNFDTGAVVNTGTASGVTSVLSGTSTVTTTGGVGDTGVLHITDDTGGQSGGLIIPDFNAGKSIGAFKAAFAVRSAAAGTPADGWSFSWGGGIAAGFGGDLEQGVGNDLRVSFDIYDNGGGEAPAIDVFWRGTTLAHVVVPLALLQTGANFEQVRVEVTNDGKVSVSQDGVPTEIKVQIPGFIGLSGAGFAFAGRTGGATSAQWIDDFALQTELYVGPISFASQPPASASIVEGTGVTLAVTVNDPTRSTFQWQRKLPADADFSDIPSATAAAYDTPALSASENGVQYRVVAKATTNTITSNPTTIAVYALNLPVTPKLSLTFDDGGPPLDGSVFGSATVESTGGIANTGYVQINTAIEGQTGSFVLEDQDGGLPVTSMTAEFYLRISGGSNPPADGMSFSWSPGVASGGFREGGSGTDLTVSFDTYDNGNAEAPAIELLWHGESLGNIRVPIDLLMDPDFVQVLVRVNNDGTCDVTYDGQVIFWHKALPNWAPLAGARYGWGGGTGGSNENNALDNIRITTTTDGELPPPAIAITVTGGEIVISFEGSLESCTTFPDWQPVQGAVSPLRLPLSSLNGTRRFWRAYR